VKPSADVALDPLDASLRHSVAQSVESRIARARDAATARIEHATRDAEALSRRAREEGEAAAEVAFARESAALRRDATTIVLDTKRAVLLELHAGVRDAVVGLRAAPDYPRLLDGLTVRARARLGPDARIVRDPPDGGGIVAEADGRRLDYTLTALAEMAWADLGNALENLWK
jgi:vacuolar-type H+-ATPase subunit E/Vma4